MAKELYKVLPLLQYLRKCSKKEQKNFLVQASPAFIRTISNLCLNFNNGNLTTHPAHIKKLKPYAKLIGTLCKKVHSIKKRKQLLQTGGFWPTLLQTLLPIVIQFLTKKK